MWYEGIESDLVKWRIMKGELDWAKSMLNDPKDPKDPENVIKGPPDKYTISGLYI
jgi:hypothetical protein